jgi:saccharopine dehydrogenase-like NADP-dependent oxidoreductase
MIVMQHQFEYSSEGKKHLLLSSLTVKGEDEIHTAMAKTVGLPVAIAARLILEEKIKSKGVHIPVIKEIYQPVLESLRNHSITFAESTTEIA